MTRVGSLRRPSRGNVDPLGIVITKYQANSTVHNTVLRQLQTGTQFSRRVRNEGQQTNTASAATEHTAHKRTLRQKYGSDPSSFRLHLH